MRVSTWGDRYSGTRPACSFRTTAITPKIVKPAARARNVWTKGPSGSSARYLPRAVDPARLVTVIGATCRSLQSENGPLEGEMKI